MIDTPILRALFGQEPLTEFLQDCWPADIYAAHGDPARLPPALLDDVLTNLDRLSERYRGNVSFFSGTKASYMVPAGKVNPKAVYDMGLSVYLTDIADSFPEIEAFVAAMEIELGLNPGCARAGIFASPAEDGINCHFDAVDIFSIQLKGNKRFRVAPVKDLVNPSGNQYVPGNTPIDDLYPQVEDAFPHWENVNLQTVELKQGSILYMPRGTWHTTEAEGDSVSISIGFNPPSAAECVLEQLRIAMLQDPKWRRPLYGLWGRGTDRDKAIEHAKTLLEQVPGISSRLPAQDLGLAQLPESIRILHLDRDNWMRRTPNARIEVTLPTPQGEVPKPNDEVVVRIHVSEKGREQGHVRIDMPAQYLPVIDWINGRASAFQVSELVEGFVELSFEQHRELLQSLTAAKYLKLLWYHPQPSNRL